MSAEQSGAGQNSDPGRETTECRTFFGQGSFERFRFTERSLDEHGTVVLTYALDDAYEFEERFTLPLPPAGATEPDPGTIDGLLDLLHWIAGVSYYKTAIPSQVATETGDPPPATRALLEALYSEGLGEFAVVNDLPALPCPRFSSREAHDVLKRPRDSAKPPRDSAKPPRDSAKPPRDSAKPPRDSAKQPRDSAKPPTRVLVPVGGGKDSAVALEIVRRSGLDTELFSVGNAPPIQRTAAVAGLPRLTVTRRIDPNLLQANRDGALNGHVPVTAIVSAVALLIAALHGFDGVALANERSASSPSTTYRGVPINHQFSKSRRAERLLAAAASEIDGAPAIFSILRPASELAIARAFARMPDYHDAFTSCNRVFTIDPARRAISWCCDCDKCRFVFLILAPFLRPEQLERIFGTQMLDDAAQFEGFARLTGTGGHKPFECVGEIEESLAAIRLLARDPRWNHHHVVQRLTREVLTRFNENDGDPSTVLELSDDHDVPPALMGALDAILGA